MGRVLSKGRAHLGDMQGRGGAELILLGGVAGA